MEKKFAKVIAKKKKLQIRTAVFPTHFKQATLIIQGAKERSSPQCAHFCDHHAVGIAVICKAVIHRSLWVGSWWVSFYLLLFWVLLLLFFTWKSLKKGGGEGRQGSEKGKKRRQERKGVGEERGEEGEEERHSKAGFKEYISFQTAYFYELETHYNS